MAKHLIKGHLYWQQNKFMKSVRIRFDEYDMREWEESQRDGRVYIRAHSFEVDVPDDFDPRPAQIASLDAQITEARAKFGALIAELQEQKARLQALTFDGVVSE